MEEMECVCQSPDLKEAKAKPKSLPKVQKRFRRKKKIMSEEKEDESLLFSIPSIRSLCSFHMDERGMCLNEECDSEPDRSSPLWKIKSEKIEEPVETEEEQEKVKPNLWEEIMTEYEDKRKQFLNNKNLSKPYEPPTPVCAKLSAVQYLEKHIFPLLCPALEETLFQAKEWECLMIQKCRFNGLDYIAELLWNRNPLHPRRRDNYRGIFEIPHSIIWLSCHPRPIYPLSWLWTKEEAITVMQTYIRRYLVCKDPECAEMRQFWKTIKMEKEQEREAKRLNSIEQIEILFNQILDKLVAEAVYQAEWKIYGCPCVVKPCHCTCHCARWCKCCKCYKRPVHDASPCDCLQPSEEKQ